VNIELQQGQNHTFYAALIGCSGDNPALAYLAGLKESAAFSWCPCRICFGNQNDIQIHVNLLSRLWKSKKGRRGEEKRKRRKVKKKENHLKTQTFSSMKISSFCGTKYFMRES